VSKQDDLIQFFYLIQMGATGDRREKLVEKCTIGFLVLDYFSHKQLISYTKQAQRRIWYILNKVISEPSPSLNYICLASGCYSNIAQIIIKPPFAKFHAFQTELALIY
jgi:hypothetical protein